MTMPEPAPRRTLTASARRALRWRHRSCPRPGVVAPLRLTAKALKVSLVVDPAAFASYAVPEGPRPRILRGTKRAAIRARQ